MKSEFSFHIHKPTNLLRFKIANIWSPQTTSKTSKIIFSIPSVNTYIYEHIILKNIHFNKLDRI